MRELGPAVTGVLLLFIAGFVRAGERNSADPELVLGAFYAVAGLGIMALVIAGVSMGIRLSRS